LKFLDLKTQYNKYQIEIDVAIKSVINSTSFIGGKIIEDFEKSLSFYNKAPHVIACSSGTDALLLSLMALDVGIGDEVITTPYSFIASAAVIVFLNAKQVFVDVKEDTYCLDVDLLKEKINDKTKAIIEVYLFGQTADMKVINNIVSDRDITVIEDAAQSFGASFKNIKSGNMSQLATTSFFPAKPLGGYGDGGAVFSKNNKLADKIKILLNHGQTKHYYHYYIGINGRLDCLQAAILKVKLKYLDNEILIRNNIANEYNKRLDNNLYTPQYIKKNCYSAYAQYCLTINQGESLSEKKTIRKQVLKKLNDENIPNAIYYPLPIHLQKPFLEMGYQKGDFPISEKLSASIFAIPIHPFLKAQERERVIQTLNNGI
jgi:UDP-2-acetamido-2-deoxy-ribo-hexuluronate aminotransferase